MTEKGHLKIWRGLPLCVTQEDVRDVHAYRPPNVKRGTSAHSSRTIKTYIAATTKTNHTIQAVLSIANQNKFVNSARTAPES